MKKEEILQVLPERLQNLIEGAVPDWEVLQEIHIRCGKMITLTLRGKKIVPEQNGQVVSRKEFRETLEYISNYSLYAFEEEIRKGYLTIPGGHRIGVAGKVVLEQGKVRTLRHISFLNIRISHEIKGCAKEVLPYLFEQDRFLSTLLVSPPGAGKTTLLRDIVRNVASGGSFFSARNVSVVDERSEIAGCYLGVPQKDVGKYCDVLDACPKSEGIRMMIRSMAPEVIAVDEIGTRQDYEAMTYALTSGCALLATVHGNSLQHIREKPLWGQILTEQMFRRIVFLQIGNAPGMIRAVYDGKGQVIAE
ncbi:MAG: stage III sporulation protein AA [Lachnospiraceae bacterium]|nr:stage III sporulation protein AA [Lachnospiraceae bacterium]